MRAAERLQAVLDKRDQGDDLTEMRLQFHQVLDAVKSTVPQEMWGATADKLDEPQQHREPLDVDTDDYGDDDPDDPTAFAEDDDEIWDDEDGEAEYADIAGEGEDA